MKLFWKGRGVMNRSIFSLTIIIASLFVALTAAGQKSPLERVVSITINGEKPDGLLQKLGKQAQVNFSYNPSIFDLNESLNGTFENKTIREILNTLFPGLLSYKEKGNYIILTKSALAKREKKEPPLVISGYVINATTGEKVSEASVYNKKTLSAAITSPYGFFKIEIDKPDEINELTVSKKGYNDKTILVEKDSKEFLSILIEGEETETLENVTGEAEIDTDIGEQIQQTNQSEHEINMENIQDTLYRKYQVSLFPFVGTNGALSGNVINEYSFNIFGGYSMGTSKFEMAGFFNFDRADMNGTQLAGYINFVGRNATGLQMAGLGNVVIHNSKAFQLAGLFNFNADTATSPQLAGLINANLGKSSGFRGAGLINFEGNNFNGFEGAGLLNANLRSSKGGMMAGLGNLQLGEYTGPQLAGLFNLNIGKLQGVQAAGLLNVAGKVNGAQIGFINVADSVQGVQIGFLSFSRGGYHKIEVSADEIFYTNLAFRTGSSNAFYNIFTAGIKPRGGKPFWTYGYGIGTSPRLTKRLFLNLDLTSNQVAEGTPVNEFSLLNKLNLGLEFQPLKRLSFSIGATLNSYLTKTTYADYPDLFTDYTPKMIVDDNYSHDINNKMWMGWKVAIRFL